MMAYLSAFANMGGMILATAGGLLLTKGWNGTYAFLQIRYLYIAILR
jgi:hypothetical protein